MKKDWKVKYKKAVWKVSGLTAEGGGDCYTKLLWWGKRSSGAIFITLTVVRVW